MKRIFATIAASGVALCVAQAQNLILNGGFEQKSAKKPTDGGLFDWDHTGNVGVFSSYELNGLAPTAVAPDASVSGNNFFAVMAKVTGSHDSSLVENPVIPAGFSQPVTLSFEYDLLADDTAAKQKRVQQGSTLSLSIGGDEVFSQSYNGPTLDDQGDSGQTGWQKVSFQLTSSEFDAIEANGVQFDFFVDQDDSTGFDFAAAIDNVSLTGSPAPDCASTALLLGGVVSALALIKRKMS